MLASIKEDNFIWFHHSFPHESSVAHTKMLCCNFCLVISKKHGSCFSLIDSYGSNGWQETTNKKWKSTLNCNLPKLSVWGRSLRDDRCRRWHGWVKGVVTQVKGKRPWADDCRGGSRACHWLRNDLLLAKQTLQTSYYLNIHEAHFDHEINKTRVIW